MIALFRSYPFKYSYFRVFVFFLIFSSFGIILQSNLAQEYISPLVEAQRLIKEGDYDIATNCLTQFLDQEILDNQEKIRGFSLLIALHLLANRYNEAEEIAILAIEMAVSSRNQPAISDFREQSALINSIIQALASRDAGNLSNSNRSFQNAFIQSGTSNRPIYRLKTAALWSVNFINQLDALGKYLDLNNEALNIAISLGYKREACRAATRLGTYYAKQNKYSFALSYFFRALEYIQNKSMSVDKVRILNNIASVYHALGDYIQAFDYYSEAWNSMNKRTVEPFQGSSLINIGNLFLSRARNTNSSEYLVNAGEYFSTYLRFHAAALPDDFSIEARIGLVRILIDQGQLEQAEADFTSILPFLAVQDCSSMLRANIMMLQAELALNKLRIFEAKESYNKALNIALNEDIPLLLIAAYCGLGQCSLAEHDRSKAIELFNLAIDTIYEIYPSIVNDSNRATLLNRSQNPVDSLINLYAVLLNEQNNYLPGLEAFRLSEYFRARSILELQNKFSNKETAAIDPSGDSRIKLLNQQRNELLKSLSLPALSNERLLELKSDIKNIDDTIDEALFSSLSRGTISTFIQPRSIESIQTNLLEPRTVLVEFCLGTQASLAFYVTHDTFKCIRLPSASAIYDSVIAYLDFLQDPSIPMEKGLPAANRLYNMLLGPFLQSATSSFDHLIIVPDGILLKLPFESLALIDNKQSSYSYLNDLYMISYAPSASFLYMLRKRPRNEYSKDVFALGISAYPQKEGSLGKFGLKSAGSFLNDIYNRSGFSLSPIPYIKSELKSLRKRFLKNNIDLLIDEDATEAALKNTDLSKYRIIHLACHAFSDDTYPLRSALVLMPNDDQEEDGFLQLTELYGIHTNADLIVLSACDTSSGRILQIEGLLGMPRIFLYAGARSTLSTLWTIHDKATAQLITYFYNSYLSGRGKAESLQSAKQKMSKSSFAHPHYWASFILNGEY